MDDVPELDDIEELDEKCQKINREIKCPNCGIVDVAKITVFNERQKTKEPK